MVSAHCIGQPKKVEPLWSKCWLTKERGWLQPTWAMTRPCTWLPLMDTKSQPSCCSNANRMWMQLTNTATHRCTTRAFGDIRQSQNFLFNTVDWCKFVTSTATLRWTSARENCAINLHKLHKIMAMIWTNAFLTRWVTWFPVKQIRLWRH